MRRFLRNLGLFLLVQLPLLGAVEWYYYATYVRDGYLDAWQVKAARLGSTSPPRLLLVGGSAFAFGVDSREVERITGVTVVNLGLHAGLGLGYILQQAEQASRPGDTVLLTPEYQLLFDGYVCDSDTVLQSLEANPLSARWIPASYVPQLLDAGLHAFAKRPRGVLVSMGEVVDPGIYRRNSFSGWGDVLAQKTRARRKPPQERLVVPPPQQTGRSLRRIAEAVRRWNARGVGVFIVPPAIPEDDRTLQAARIEEILARARSAGLTIVGETGDGLPRPLFLDTVYHLTAKGRRLNTKRYLTAIGPLLARQPWAAKSQDPGAAF